MIPKKNLIIMNELFKELENELDNLTNEQRDWLLQQQSSNEYTINHCVRRWLQATEELLDT